ncbi:hypothetical protein D3C77_461400 [compost metagenome]
MPTPAAANRNAKFSPPKIAAKVQAADIPENTINDKVKPILSVNGPSKSRASAKHKKNADNMLEAETVLQP